jgi:hypothetical protein
MKRIDQKPTDYYNDLVPTDKAMEIIRKNQKPDNLDDWKGFDFDGLASKSDPR